MIRNEYGGCLPLEINNENYNFFLKYENVVEIDCGRSGIQYVVTAGKYKRIWLPVYNCPSVIERLKNIKNLKILLYNINSDFSPIIDENDFFEKDLFVYINYWGCLIKSNIDYTLDLCKNHNVDLLIDNSVALFSKPINNVYNIYSCRKFLGVADGAYIIGKRMKDIPLIRSNMASNYIFLLKTIENGSDYSYNDYLKNEKTFDERIVPFEMSPITRKLLSSINYNEILEKRKRNFLCLRNIFINNSLPLDYDSDSPYVFPYYAKNIDLNKILLEKNIFVSKHWKNVLLSHISNSFEKDLAERVIPIPIDQRYSVKEVERIGEIIKALDN